jgi:hypothetical protein
LVAHAQAGNDCFAVLVAHAQAGNDCFAVCLLTAQRRTAVRDLRKGKEGSNKGEFNYSFNKGSTAFYGFHEKKRTIRVLDEE